MPTEKAPADSKQWPTGSCNVSSQAQLQRSFLFQQHGSRLNDTGSTRKIIEQIRNRTVIHPTSGSLIQRISRAGVARTGWLRRPLAAVEASFLLAIGRSRATPSFRATSTFRLEARSQPSLQLPSSLSLPLINLLSPPRAHPSSNFFFLSSFIG